MTTVDLLDHILDQLAQIRIRCPELRFAQLIAIVGMLAEDETGQSLWDVEDADFVAALERFHADVARRESNAEPGAAPDRDGVQSAPPFTASEPPRQVS